MFSHDNSIDVPGTTRVFDESGNTVQTDHVNLFPVPSEDPKDPLNWSKGRKWIMLLCIIWYQFVVNLQAASLYAVYEPLSENTGLSLNDLNAGVGYFYLFIGIACIFSQPLALGFGKKPIYIISALACCLLNLWTAFVDTNAQWIGSRLLLGFFISPSYTLIQVSISDVFFMHERGLPMGLYALQLYTGGALGPILSGYIYDGMGWKAIVWLSSGLTGLTALLLIFLLEETSYVRRSAMEAASAPTVATLNEGQVEEENNDVKLDAIEAGVHEVQHQGIAPRPRVISSWPGPRPWKFEKPHPQCGAIIGRCLFQCFALLRSPIIWWCGITFGSFQVYYNFVAALASGVLSVEPYNMSSSAIGLTFISSLIASFPAAAFGGYFVDWYGLRQARRNHGISEAEHKLNLYIICLIATPIGLLMMGLGPYYSAHWIVFVIGCGIVNFVGAFGTLVTVTYAFDCFHEIQPENPESPSASAQDAAPYLLISILICMIVSFGFNYAITPWCFDWGLRNFGITSAIMSIVFNGSTLILVIWGKRMRRSGETYYKKIINW
ncbi:uncharacterized protein IL334_003148 [Kwoniella shivajii]|uniref:Major facilitator superfamily (MFS) profile domain-containing protein n=1 Tax=Kwoniella shivajii TaxID=564305 RepID=A0ABZ1CX28_9TREE|nr:hypothetical protein IL334_003148 [Kwoniella shivajii]